MEKIYGHKIYSVHSSTWWSSEEYITGSRSQMKWCKFYNSKTVVWSHIKPANISSYSTMIPDHHCPQTSAMGTV